MATPPIPADVFWDAVAYFWRERARGVRTGVAMNGFAQTMQDLLIQAGVRREDIFTKSQSAELPGFFRAAKRWDVVVVESGQLRVLPHC